MAHLHNQPLACTESARGRGGTCAAVERQLGGGVEFLDEELGERYPVVGVERLVAFLPVQHQVVVGVRV